VRVNVNNLQQALGSIKRNTEQALHHAEGLRAEDNSREDYWRGQIATLTAERDEARKLLERFCYVYNHPRETDCYRSIRDDIRAFLSSAPAQPEKRARAIALIDDWLARDPIAGEDADLERLKLALNASADNRKPFPAQPPFQAPHQWRITSEEHASGGSSFGIATNRVIFRDEVIKMLDHAQPPTVEERVAEVEHRLAKLEAH